MATSFHCRHERDPTVVQCSLRAATDEVGLDNAMKKDDSNARR